MTTRRKVAHLSGGVLGLVFCAVLGFDFTVSAGFLIGIAWVCLFETVAPDR